MIVPAPPPIPVWELALGVDEDPHGWIGWEVTSLRPDGSTRMYGFDEREEIVTSEQASAEAIRRESEVLGPGVKLTMRLREVRIVVSAEISPN